MSTRSKPRVRVDKRPGFWRWECLDRTPGVHAWSGRSEGDVRWSQQDAMHAALVHVAEKHTPRPPADIAELVGLADYSKPPPFWTDPDLLNDATYDDPMDRTHNEGARRD